MLASADSRDWISLRAVARMLGVSNKTAAKVVRAGNVRSRLLPGMGDRQYARADAVRLAAEAERIADAPSCPNGPPM